jgi:hypothetical protein
MSTTQTVDNVRALYEELRAIVEEQRRSIGELREQLGNEREVRRQLVQKGLRDLGELRALRQALHEIELTLTAGRRSAGGRTQRGNARP